MEHHQICSNKGMFDFSFVRHMSGSSLCSYIRIFSRYFHGVITTGEQNRDDLDNSIIEPLEIVIASESGCKQDGDLNNDATDLSCTESDKVAKVVQDIINDVDGAGSDFEVNGVNSNKKVHWIRNQTNDLENLGPVHPVSSTEPESMENIQLEDDNTDVLYDDLDHGEHDAIYFSRITSFYPAISLLDHSCGCPEDNAEKVTVRAKGAFKSNPASIGDQFEGNPSIDSDKTNASGCTDGSEGFGSVDLSDVDESGYFTETHFTNTPSFCLKSEKSIHFDEESEPYYSAERKCFENSSKERTDKPFVIDATIEQSAETVDITNSAKVNKVITEFANRPIHFGKSLHHGPITDNGNSKMLTKSVRISSDLSESRMSKRSEQDKIRSLFLREHPLEVLFSQRKKVTQINRRKRKPSLLSLLNCASGRL